jgi:hypothetical protein
VVRIAILTVSTAIGNVSTHSAKVLSSLLFGPLANLVPPDSVSKQVSFRSYGSQSHSSPLAKTSSRLIRAAPAVIAFRRA